MRYAQRINKANGWKGHLWQGRFFSSPLDEAYTWSAIRYIERNPVRAKMVDKAENYTWSSAPAHCGLINNPLLSTLDNLGGVISKASWSDWLALSEDEEISGEIRRNVEKGLPCGANAFIECLEKLSKRSSKYLPQGRPVKNKG